MKTGNDMFGRCFLAAIAAGLSTQAATAQPSVDLGDLIRSRVQDAVNRRVPDAPASSAQGPGDARGAKPQGYYVQSNDYAPERATRSRGANKLQGTQQDALKCNAMLDIGAIARINGNKDVRAQTFLQPDKGRDRVPLWDLIIDTNPELSKLSPEAAEPRMVVVRDKYTNEHLYQYLDNTDLLVKEYRLCQAKGLIRTP